MKNRKSADSQGASAASEPDLFFLKQAGAGPFQGSLPLWPFAPRNMCAGHRLWQCVRNNCMFVTLLHVGLLPQVAVDSGCQGRCWLLKTVKAMKKTNSCNSSRCSSCGPPSFKRVSQNRCRICSGPGWQACHFQLQSLAFLVWSFRLSGAKAKVLIWKIWKEGLCSFLSKVPLLVVLLVVPVVALNLYGNLEPRRRSCALKLPLAPNNGVRLYWKIPPWGGTAKH